MISSHRWRVVGGSDAEAGSRQSAASNANPGLGVAFTAYPPAPISASSFSS